MRSADKQYQCNWDVERRPNRAIHDTIHGGGGWALLLDGYAKTMADQP